MIRDKSSAGSQLGGATSPACSARLQPTGRGGISDQSIENAKMYGRLGASLLVGSNIRVLEGCQGKLGGKRVSCPTGRGERIAGRGLIKGRLAGALARTVRGGAGQ